MVHWRLQLQLLIKAIIVLFLFPIARGILTPQNVELQNLETNPWIVSSWEKVTSWAIARHLIPRPSPSTFAHTEEVQVVVLHSSMPCAVLRLFKHGASLWMVVFGPRKLWFKFWTSGHRRLSPIVIRYYWFGYSFLLNPGFLLILLFRLQWHLVIF